MTAHERTAMTRREPPDGDARTDRSERLAARDARRVWHPYTQHARDAEPLEVVGARGSVLALGTCAVCHAVSKGKGGSSANPSAPPFSTIAEVKGMSAMALNVALLTPHHAMPNIMLYPQERADIIAYILSLKSD